jgi:hypothetical protein
VQLGRTNLLTFTPAGTATSGTIYIRDREGTQWAVRVLGATGRTRVLRYEPQHTRVARCGLSTRWSGAARSDESPRSDEPVSQVRLRAGRQLTVIDVSDVGLLAQGDMRLLPGTHVEVHLVPLTGDCSSAAVWFARSSATCRTIGSSTVARSPSSGLFKRGPFRPAPLRPTPFRPALPGIPFPRHPPPPRQRGQAIP